MEYNIDTIHEILDDIVDSIDESLFVGLNGGVVLCEETKFHDQAVNEDLVILGEYSRFGVFRKINIYYGSIKRLYPHYTYDQLKVRLTDLINHELRHHIEYKAGVNDLDVEDHEFIERHKQNRINKNRE